MARSQTKDQRAQGKRRTGQRRAHRSRGRSSQLFWGKIAGTIGPRGTRASANTSGPDFTESNEPLVKLRTFEKDPHRTKKACFFCRTGLEGANAFQSDDPAV